MSQKRRHRKPPGVSGKSLTLLRKVFARPGRLAIIATVSLMLAWLVVAKALPLALAQSYPDLALALNPSNPAALIAKARQFRDRLLAQEAIPSETGSAQANAVPSTPVNTLSRLPGAKDGADPEQLRSVRGALQSEIRALALRAISREPLNAEAYRLLAETEAGPDRARILMQEAVKRSRHESAAVFWLLNDGFSRKDYQTALDYAEILLQTRPELTDFVLSYVSLVALEPAGLPLVAGALAKRPSWRKAFFAFLPRSPQRGDALFQIVSALKERGSTLSAEELAPFLDVLIQGGRADAAYNVWLQSLSEAELANLGLLFNSRFETTPSGLPFDWRLSAGLNAVTEFVPSGTQNERVLHISFGSGRVKFPELRQVLFLPSGRYRLEGKLRGRIIAKRGLRWQMLCATGQGRPLAETDMLMGVTEEWRLFSFDVEVPEGSACAGQILRLYHDARSASEELISGEIWTGGLSLERVRG
jgi:hypothetical protein